MLRYAIERLGLNIYSEVAYATPTGKAALVLKRKGLQAVTVHRLIYTPEIVSVPIIDKKTQEPKTDKDGKIIYMKKVKFKKRLSLSERIKLIVVDEASMLNKNTWQDILSFHKPVILLSDLKQLPPIGSEPIDPVKNPDVILDEVMRQGKDSDIIIAAERAANGLLFKNELAKWCDQKLIAYENKDVHFIHHDLLTDNIMLSADIILCSKTNTRNDINNYMRKILGFKSLLPQKGDKLICRRNDETTCLPTTIDVHLVNGLIGYCTSNLELETITPSTFEMKFKPDFINEEFPQLTVNLNLFTGLDKKGKELTKDTRQHIMHFGDGQKFEFGYAITTHLSQGSEWDNVLLFAEWMGDIEYMKKLIYTGITRAKKKLIVVMPPYNGVIPYYNRNQDGE